jgi:hypothetical protein
MCTAQVLVDRTLWCSFFFKMLPPSPFFLFFCFLSIDFFSYNYKQHFATFYVSLEEWLTFYYRWPNFFEVFLIFFYFWNFKFKWLCSNLYHVRNPAWMETTVWLYLLYICHTVIHRKLQNVVYNYMKKSRC